MNCIFTEECRKTYTEDDCLICSDYTNIDSLREVQEQVELARLKQKYDKGDK